MTEMAVVLFIFTVGIIGGLGVLERTDNFVAHNSARLRTDSTNSLGLQAVVDVITESSMQFIDTTMRVHDGPGMLDVNSDRFMFSSFPLVQCISPTCGFHTQSGTVPNSSKFQCGHEYRTGFSTSSLQRGKIWPGDQAFCPLDGFPTTQIVTLDILKLFAARGRDGSFSTGMGGDVKPDWNSLVILAPFSELEGKAELRRYILEVSDLLGGALSSSGDHPFDADPPDMVKLFDFGSDGTTDGVPDGSVPVRAEDSDAEQESFFTGLLSGEPAVVISKVLGSSTSYPWRTVSVVIRLRDGFTNCLVRHYETSSVYWMSSCTIMRAPDVLASNLTEFAVSTATSHPYDPVNSPEGVRDSGVVRITIGTTDRVARKGKTEWSHNVNTLLLQPRN